MTVLATARVLLSLEEQPDAGPRFLAVEEPEEGPDPSARPRFLLGLDEALVAALSSRDQFVSMAVEVDGEVIWLATLSPVERVLGATESFRFSVPVRGDAPGPAFDHPLGGDQLHYHGPPPGKAAIRVLGVVLTPDGPRHFALVTDGVAVGVTESTGDGVEVDEIQCGGPGARYDGRKGTQDIPPGHGLPRSEVGRRHAAKLGITRFALEAGRHCYKPVTWIDEGMSVLREYWGTELRVPHFDSDARLTNPSTRLPQSIEECDWVFSSQDYLSVTGPSSSTGGPTRITLTGTKQVTRATAGRRTEVQIVLEFSDFAPRAAAWKQDAFGVLTPYSPDVPSEVLRRFQTKTVTTKEFEGDTEVSSLVERYTWWNPLTWRYRLQPGVAEYTIDDYNGQAYILDEDAETGDSAEAYLWPAERLGLNSVELTTPIFDEAGWAVGSLTRKAGPRLPRAALKERIGNTPWEETDFEDVYVTGAGHGIYLDLSGQQPLWQQVRFAQSTLDVEQLRVSRVVSGGYVLQERTGNYRILAREGGDYLYGDGKTYLDPYEDLRLAEAQVVNYVAQGEGGHGTITTKYGPDGGYLGSQEESGLSGSLPAAQRRSDLLPSPDLYDSPEQAASALAASRLENQAIKVQVIQADLEEHREIREVKEAVTWAEDLEELEELAAEELRQTSAATISLTLPGNFLIREGQRAAVVVRRRTLLMLIERARWVPSSGGVTTEISGRVALV